MKQEWLRSLFMLALTFCMGSLPAMAGPTFSSLGPNNSYSTSSGWAVSGSDFCPLGCFSTGDLFTASGTGTIAVNTIDLAVTAGDISASGFSASLWTDNRGVPGSQVTNAYWSLTTSLASFTCCGVVTVGDIQGVTITGGQQYFMVLSPLDPATNDDFADNTQGVTGVEIYSTNGGTTWQSNGTQTIAAFDINPVPEPGSLFLFGIGLIAILGVRRRHSAR